MGLVTLPLDSGPMLSCWPGDQVCPGDLAVGGNFVFCLIIVVIFIGLGRAHKLGGGVLKLSNGRQATKGWYHFYGGS